MLIIFPFLRTCTYSRVRLIDRLNNSYHNETYYRRHNDDHDRFDQ